MKQLLALLTLIALVGCATAHQDATSKTVTHNKDGSISTNEMNVHLGITASGNAKQAIEAMKASAGKTASAGINGVSQESTLSDLIDSITKLIQAGGTTLAK